MKKRNYAYLSLPIIVTLVILYLCCLIPPSDIPNVNNFLFLPIDKVVHFLMYVTLSSSCFFAYIHISITSGKVEKWIAFLWCMLYPILFGGLIEIIQAKYCPGRSGDWFDFLADSLGVLVMIPFAFLYGNYIHKKYESKK